LVWDGMSWGLGDAVVVRELGKFFVRVNQVLVRLWARRGSKSDRMWSVSCWVLAMRGSV
jgi:hypothetical protein